MYPILLNGNLTDLQLAFIITVPIALALFIGIALYIPISHFFKRKNFQIQFYKKVYQTALDYDYYLINQFVFKIDDNKNALVDHVLFGDKFIYVITSQYYEGDLVGKATDGSLVFISHRGKKAYTDNPIIQSKNLSKKLSSATGLNASLLIGIVLINDDCKVQVTSDSKQFYIIQKKRFPALIRAIEKRPLPAINEQQLAKAVQAIAKANRRKK